MTMSRMIYKISPVEDPDHGESGAALIFVIVIAAICAIACSVTFKATTRLVQSTGSKRVDAVAFNIAEAGKEHAIAQLRTVAYRPHSNGVDSIFTSQAFDVGYYTVRCSANVRTDTLWIRSYGFSATQQRCIEAKVRKSGMPPFNPRGILGAITANTSVEFTGNMVVDGCDHSDNGHANGLAGNYAISTTGTVNPAGSTSFGGMGCPPAAHPHDPVCAGAFQEGISSSDIPSEPWDVLGVTEDELDQYRTEPSRTYTGAGIYYLTGDAGTVHFSDASGILIIHDANGTADFLANHGTFTGLIICDDVSKLAGNVTLIGAMVIISTADKVGAGGANVLYSQSVIDNLRSYCGAGNKNIDQISWREL